MGATGIVSSLGSRIRQRREASGLTTEEVAVALGRSAFTVAGWELGRCTPPPNVLIRLAALLGTTTSDLRGEQ